MEFKTDGDAMKEILDHMLWSLILYWSFRVGFGEF